MQAVKRRNSRQRFRISRTYIHWTLLRSCSFLFCFYCNL